ncbi:hypothetical protein AAY78_03260 [Microbacterium sp. Ag1]|nr:hypothetical protein AAY78_03260 [Microbacterium sp. Ag1]
MEMGFRLARRLACIAEMVHAIWLERIADTCGHLGDDPGHLLALSIGHLFQRENMSPRRHDKGPSRSLALIYEGNH